MSKLKVLLSDETMSQWKTAQLPQQLSGQRSDASWCWRFLFKKQINQFWGEKLQNFIINIHKIWRIRSGAFIILIYFMVALWITVSAVFYPHSACFPALLLQAAMIITDREQGKWASVQKTLQHLSTKLTFCVILDIKSADNCPLAYWSTEWLMSSH